MSNGDKVGSGHQNYVMRPVVRLPRPAYFCAQHGAWILSTYDDVTSALRNPRIGAIGSTRNAQAGATNAALTDTAHVVVRRATHRALSAAQIGEWRLALTPLALDLVESMGNRDVDLVAELATPWCTALAAMAVGVPQAVLSECTAHANTLFLASARATSGTPHAETGNAARALASLLSSAEPTTGSPVTLPGAVQAFVAISQSLPSAMACIWRTLLMRAEQITIYRCNPEHRARMIEELLRIASPSQAVFRVAHETVPIGDVTIPANEHIILRLAEANVDPAVFVAPLEIRLDRTTSPHLALGMGPHHCAGASVVRMALECTTTALFVSEHATTMTISEHVNVPWIDGYAIDGPMAVHVHFQSRKSPTSRGNDSVGNVSPSNAPRVPIMFKR